MQLVHRLVNRDPPGYRVSFDGVEVGSIAKRPHHIQLHDYWHWGVDTMKLIAHGGRPPTFEAALGDFKLAVKLAVTHWHQNQPADLWKENRDYIKHSAERHLHR